MTDFPVGTCMTRGVQELVDAMRWRDSWVYCGWQDIRLRYRRSLLGPWWLTASMAVTIAVLGLLWSQIFQLSITTYLPFFAIGLVVWTWISTQINEACTGFTQFEHIIKQTRLPYPTYLLRLGIRNTLILAHNAVVIVLVLLVCGTGWHGIAWLSIVGLVLVAVIAVFLSVLVAIFCTRYRDFPPLVGNLLQIAFFLTPILWEPSALRAKAWLAELNPLFHWIEVIRQPLLGHIPSSVHYLWTAGSILLIGALAVWLLGRQRDRIAYWL
jgi:lipopolysaccharide transport system permease protein